MAPAGPTPANDKLHILWFDLDLSIIGLLGLLGNLFWFLRFFHQWVASERRKESVIPVMFWYWSILGTIFLGAYFIIIGNVSGTLAYLPNAFVYIRNLMLIQRKRRFEAGAKGPGSPLPGDLSESAEEAEAGMAKGLSARFVLVLAGAIGLVCLLAGTILGLLLGRSLGPTN